MGQVGQTPVTHSKLHWELWAGPASRLWTEIKSVITRLFPKVLGLLLWTSGAQRNRTFSLLHRSPIAKSDCCSPWGLELG